MLDTILGKHLSAERFQGDAAFGMRPCFGRATFKFGNLFWREFIIKVTEFLANCFGDHELFRRGQSADLFQNFCRAHDGNLPQPNRQARGFSLFIPHSTFRALMIPREILKKIRQIELRTNRLVSETGSTQRPTRPTFTP